MTTSNDTPYLTHFISWLDEEEREAREEAVKKETVVRKLLKRRRITAEQAREKLRGFDYCSFLDGYYGSRERMAESTAYARSREAAERFNGEPEELYLWFDVEERKAREKAGENEAIAGGLLKRYHITAEQADTLDALDYNSFQDGAHGFNEHMAEATAYACAREAVKNYATLYR